MDASVALGARAGEEEDAPRSRRLAGLLVKRPVLTLAIAVTLVALAAASVYTLAELRRFRRLDADRFTYIYAASGSSKPPQFLAHFSAGPTEIYQPITLDKVPARLIEAVVAAEDHRFRSHIGIDLRSILRAAWVNLTSLRIRQGGSTITQQLVKLRLLTSERTVGRKLREVWLAVVLERFYSKDQILEAYLNEVGWGARSGISVRGIRAAARVYFGQEPTQLTSANAALLAAMIKAPNRYASELHREETRARRDWILRRMREAGALDHKEFARARGTSIRLGAKIPSITGGHFVDMVRREGREQHAVSRSGDGPVWIITTLNENLQRIAESVVATQLARLERRFPELRRRDPKERLQAVLIALDPANGEIRALIGGRDYQTSQFNRAIHARRQPGSAFKPFVYCAALTSSTATVTPMSLIDDSPVVLTVGTRLWMPRNHADRYKGWVTVREALADSLNAATVRIAMDIGLDAVVSTAKRLGIESPLEPTPALALGALEVTPMELARAYLPFANGGWRPAAGRVIESVTVGESVAQRPTPKRERVLSGEGAHLMTALLQDVVERGTARNARVGGVLGQFAGKTGTSNDGRDAWFVGYSSRLLTLVWVGFDTGDPHGLTAAEAAIPIWVEFMRRAIAIEPPASQSLRSPSEVIPMR